MGNFSAEQALMSGFRVVARNPMALLAWAGVYLVFGVLPQAILWVRIWPLMANQAAHPSPDPQAAVAAMSGFTAWWPVLWLLGLVLFALMYGAVYRAVLDPDDKRYFYLRLGMRELWLGLTTLALLVLFFIGCMIVGVAVTLIGHSAPGIVTFVAVLAALVGVIWLAMRFSLAPPMAFAERRFIFLESWGLTKGHALKLFGVALALVVMVLVLEMVIFAPFAIAMGLAGVFSAGAKTAASDPALMLQHAAPWIVVGGLVLSIFAALIYAVLGAPWADIYRQLAPEREPAS